MRHATTLKDGAKGVGVGLLLGAWLAVVASSAVGLWAPMMFCGAVLGAAGVYGFIYVRGRAGVSTGFASGWQVARTMGRRSVRQSARLTRPGLAKRPRVPIEECGFQLGRARRPVGRRRIYASHEDVVLVVAPPRMGKTALLANAVIDAPGAVVVTSTKVDVVRLTSLRAAKEALLMLNPEAMAGAPSSLKWSPIVGCEAPQVAIERAAYLIAGSPKTGALSVNLV